jgi:hypothetical protein
MPRPAVPIGITYTRLPLVNGLASSIHINL